MGHVFCPPWDRGWHAAVHQVCRNTSNFIYLKYFDTYLTNIALYLLIIRVYAFILARYSNFLVIVLSYFASLVFNYALFIKL